jgi:hypothetical protein
MYVWQKNASRLLLHYPPVRSPMTCVFDCLQVAAMPTGRDLPRSNALLRQCAGSGSCYNTYIIYYAYLAPLFVNDFFATRRLKTLTHDARMHAMSERMNECGCARTYTRTDSNARAHTRNQPHTHARTHAHARTHTHNTCASHGQFVGNTCTWASPTN